MEVTSQRADGILLPERLDDLISALDRRGYAVLGPTVRDQTLDWKRIRNIRDLPAGWTANQSPGSYQLAKRSDDKRFGFGAVPTTLKRLTHLPEVTLFAAQSPFRVLPNEAKPEKTAVIGVRACDLAAMKILDRVLLEDRYVDPHYAAHREHLFLVAVNCSDPADVCFCTTFDTGPRATEGFDIALTEVAIEGATAFYAEAGSGAGADVLEEIGFERADDAARTAAMEVCNAAAVKLRPSTPRIPDRFDDAEWDRVAARCYGCANCTQICPTCFCVTVEDSSDIRQTCAERTRKWDSCFTLGHSYIHGGSVRQSLKSRYRQWLTHKLSHWQDQFGTPGCTGCGRCITWCPAGIDMREVAGSLANGGSA